MRTTQDGTTIPWPPALSAVFFCSSAFAGGTSEADGAAVVDGCAVDSLVLPTVSGIIGFSVLPTVDGTAVRAASAGLDRTVCVLYQLRQADGIISANKC